MRQPDTNLKKFLKGIAMLCIIVATLVCVAALMETVRYSVAFLAVENAARFGIRYAVTDMWDVKYCDDAGLALGLTRADMSDGRADCNAAMHFRPVTLKGVAF